MRVSQVLHAMDKDDTVVIVDLYGKGDEVGRKRRVRNDNSR